MQLFKDSTLITDAIKLSGFSQSALALSTVAAVSASLDEGIYDVWCDADCYIKVASQASHTATPVTASNGYLLRSGNTVPVIIGGGDKIGAIVSAGAGTLSLHRVR